MKKVLASIVLILTCTGCPDDPSAQLVIFNETDAAILAVFFVRAGDSAPGLDNEIISPIAPGAERSLRVPVGEFCTDYVAFVELDRDIMCRLADGEETSIDGLGFDIGIACPGDTFRWFVRAGGECVVK